MSLTIYSSPPPAYSCVDISAARGTVSLGVAIATHVVHIELGRVALQYQ